MAFYMYQATFKPEAWAAMIQKPSDFRERNRKLIEALNGRVIDGWFQYGEFDIMLILEFPDSVDMAAAAMAAFAGGAATAYKVTPLWSVDEGLNGLERAGKLPYTPPGG